MTRNKSRNGENNNNTESIDSYGSSASEEGNQSSNGGPNAEIRKFSSHSRVNGWSWPLHPRQVISWVILLFITSYYFCTIATALWTYYIYPGYSIPAVVAFIHIVTQIGCVSINPADPNVRGRDSTAPLPPFDRSKHAHVIENLYCNICETNVTDDAKHCSYCNKCIEEFDHHCFWLNNCIGGRNYRIFIVCLVSAILFCFLVVGVTTVEIALYFVNRKLLYSDWVKNNVPPTTTISSPTRPTTLEPNASTGAAGAETGNRDHHLFIYMAPSSEVVWIAVAFFYLILNLLAIGLIGHLLGFHVYLMSRKLSTYSYMMVMRDREIANREKQANEEGAKDTPSCSAKSKGRIAPGEADVERRRQQQQQQQTGEGEGNSKSALSDEEKRSFGQELRNGVGEKRGRGQQQPTELAATSPSWGLPTLPTLPTTTTRKRETLTTSASSPNKKDAAGTSASTDGVRSSMPEDGVVVESSPPVTDGSPTLSDASKPGSEVVEGKRRRKRKTRKRKSTPPGNQDLATNYESELGVGAPTPSDCASPQSEVGFEIQNLSPRRRSMGADSGVVISPGNLPPLVKSPPLLLKPKDETEITFGSPLTEIPIDDIKSFYRSEIQYVNFA